MMSKQAILILFKLLNFGVMLAVAYYLWDKYGKPYMEGEFAQKRDESEGLRRTHSVLLQEKKFIAKMNRMEQQEQAALKGQLSAWRKAVAQEYESLDHERKVRQTALKKRISAQIECVEQHQQYKELRDVAMKNARMQLEKIFADPTAQKKFVATMLKRMDANT